MHLILAMNLNVLIYYFLQSWQTTVGNIFLTLAFVGFREFIMWSSIIFQTTSLFFIYMFSLLESMHNGIQFLEGVL